MSSVPLSPTTIFGLVRSMISLSNCRARRVLERDVSATTARH